MKRMTTELLAGLVLAGLAMATTRATAQEYTFTTLAGPPEAGPGAIDGTGSAARFYYPGGVAVDSAGNVYVADWYNCTIRKVTPGGVVTTLAGLAGSSGSADGTGGAARFNTPTGVAVDSAGNVYVADSSNNTIRKVTPGGVVTTLAGLAGNSGSADGTGSAARFGRPPYGGPTGVAVDSAGNVYVADSGNSRIRKVTPGGLVTTLAGWGTGSADGTGGAAQFYYPKGVAVDNAGNVYVADTFNNTIRKVTPGGLVTTLAAGFAWPCGVAVDSAANVYVADTEDYTIGKVTPGGVVTTLAGLAGSPGSADGTGSAARFNVPGGVAVDSAGNVYVGEWDNNTIRKVTPGGVVTTLTGLAGGSGSADGTGGAARFNTPTGVAVDSAGNVYVTDTGNHTIRKVTPARVVTTLAGKALFDQWGDPIGGYADGTGGAARFYRPEGVAADSAGNLYVADSWNHTIRKVTPGGVVTTLAGLAGTSGSADGTGSAARFNWPYGVAVDSAADLFVADCYNHTIRKVTPDGVVTTLAGLAGSPGSADGTGSAARFTLPQGVAVDSAGNVYVADSGNNTIRKVTPGGMVTTLAGLTGNWGTADGTASAARFNGPSGVAVDSAGNVYVTDSGNHTIRIGGVACPDAPTIDLAVGPVGQLRQLDTSPQTAVAWQWRLTRDPAASSASLSAANVRNPTFTPDVADLYVFRLEAADAAGAVRSIGTLAFTAYAGPAPPSILLNDGSFGVRSNYFGFNVSGSAGQVVVVETSTDLLNWTELATNTVGASPFYFRDPAPPNSPCRFYRARAQ
jgi:hypothetical protein